MKRRSLLKLSVAGLSLPWLTACNLGAPEPVESTMYAVELWADSNPDDFANSRVVLAASSNLVASIEHAGLYSMKDPLVHKLPSGLLVRVSCERIATGHFHCSISHNNESVSMGKYSGTFTVRMFPAGHPSYILAVTDKPGTGPGA